MLIIPVLTSYSIGAVLPIAALISALFVVAVELTFTLVVVDATVTVEVFISTLMLLRGAVTITLAIFAPYVKLVNPPCADVSCVGSPG